MAEYIINEPYVNSTVNASVTATTTSFTVFNQDANRAQLIFCHSGSAGAGVFLLFGTGSVSTTNATVFLNNQIYTNEWYKGPVSAVFLTGSSTTKLFATSIQK